MATTDFSYDKDRAIAAVLGSVPRLARVYCRELKGKTSVVTPNKSRKILGKVTDELYITLPLCCSPISSHLWPNASRASRTAGAC